MMRGMRWILVVVLLLLPISAGAHDYWLSPERFEIAAGQRLTVDLLLGGHFVVEEPRPYQPKRTQSFVLVAGDEVVDLRRQAREGATPVLDGVVVEREGPTLLGMERDWVDIQLSDDRFTEYLEHEGLSNIAALRDRQGHRETERECYTRALKSLVVVGEGKGPTVHDRVLGHRLEIVMLDDPHALPKDGVLRARVLYRGKPLTGAQVTAHHRTHRDQGKVSTHTAKTDDEGIARFEIGTPGFWLLRMVHMVPCPTCSYTDWESYWTSFSFMRS